jgi:hypothetical protein
MRDHSHGRINGSATAAFATVCERKLDMVSVLRAPANSGEQFYGALVCAENVESVKGTRQRTAPARPFARRRALLIFQALPSASLARSSTRNFFEKTAGILRRRVRARIVNGLRPHHDICN